MYSIGQVAEMFGLPISTLRYYDKQGLFPNMERVSGIRKFSEAEIEALRVIECLKKAGMEIKDIRQFMDWCSEGPSTYPQRKAMFEERKAHMEAEITRMNRALDMLKFKCWYYEQAIKDGSEDRLKTLIPYHLLNGGSKKVKIGLCLRSAPFCRLNRKTHSQHFKRCLQTGKSI